MNRSATQFMAAVAAVTLLAVSCGSDGGGDTASDDPGQGDLVAEDLHGTWMTEDGEFTLEFSDDGSTLTLTSEHFDGCESAYEHRISDREVDLDIECESDGDLAEGENAGVTHVYRASWLLVWQVGLASEGAVGPAGPGEFAGGPQPGVFALAVQAITEDQSSTVNYTAAVGSSLDQL